MTHYSGSNKYPTKKSLKEAIKNDPNSVELVDPSMFNAVSGTVPEILEQKNPFTVTNHPKRSWFAEITIALKGKYKDQIVVR